jgi:hypothetical protein
MSISKCIRIVTPVLLFVAAGVAEYLSVQAVLDNLGDGIGRLFGEPARPNHNAAVVGWEWTAVTCLVLGIISSWWEFRCFRNLRRANLALQTP